MADLENTTPVTFDDFTAYLRSLLVTFFEFEAIADAQFKDAGDPYILAGISRKLAHQAAEDAEIFLVRVEKAGVAA